MQYVPGHGFVEESSLFRISKENLLAGAVFGGSIVAAGVYLYATSGSSSQTAVRTAGVPGLANLGNTCYANALLQGLSSVPCVVQWLKDVETSGEDATEFLGALKDIVLKLNKEDPLLYNAGGVVRALIAKGWQIGIGVEHDLHELLNVFLATGDEELRAIRRNFLRTSLIDVAGENSALSSSVAPSTPLKQLIFDRCAETVRMDARLRAPFFGLTATQLRCCDNTCAVKKVRYDSCSVISVQIPKMSPDRTVTLELLLRKYFCMEVIRGASCDECKKRTGRVDSGLFKKQGFSKLPQCLVIRVERGAVMPSGAIFKISDHVEFGETLDVRDLCFYRNKEDEYDRMMKRNEASRLPEVTSRIVGGAERELNPLLGGRSKEQGLAAANLCTIDGGSFVAERREAARYRYQLRAVSEHRGIPETGHFVTYRRGVTDPHSWYLTNDDQVTRVPYSKVAACEAYMLYYERIQPSRWHRTPSYSLVPNLSL